MFNNTDNLFNNELPNEAAVPKDMQSSGHLPLLEWIRRAGENVDFQARFSQHLQRLSQLRGLFPVFQLG